MGAEQQSIRSVGLYIEIKRFPFTLIEEESVLTLQVDGSVILDGCL